MASRSSRYDLRRAQGQRGARPAPRAACLLAMGLMWACSGARPSHHLPPGDGGSEPASSGDARRDNEADRDSAAAGDRAVLGGGADAGLATAIVVTTPSGLTAAQTLDGYCDLLEAIAAANTDQAVHECPAGHGSDHIVLQAGAAYLVGQTLSLTSALTIDVESRAPLSDLTVVGEHARARIVGIAGFGSGTPDPTSTCLIAANAPGKSIKLFDVALSQEEGPNLTGVCVTSGTFDLRRGRVSGFRAGGMRGTCLPESGCDHETRDDATTVRVLSSLIDGNRSPGHGGGISSEGSGMTLVVEHSSIVNNVAELSGGGLYYGGGWGTQRLEHSTVSGNRAGSGGGLFVAFTACTATYLYVLNSTIAYNSATRLGGGVHFDANHDPCYSQDLTVLASIISNNAAAAASQSNVNADWEGGQFTCDRGSLIYVAPDLPRPSQALGTACRFDLPDAMLAPLTSMGGPGELPLHPLRRGSPALDAAPDDAAPDQQRDFWISLVDPPEPAAWTVFDRVVDGDGDGVAVRDLGAYEATDVWQTELLPVAVRGGAPHLVATEIAGSDRGAGTELAARGAGHEFVTYRLPIAEPGSYGISARVRQGPDGGQFQAAVADDPDGPWTELGIRQDTYAPAGAFAELTLVPAHSFASAGPRFIRFTVTGRSSASAGYRLFLDHIKVSKLP